MSECLKAPYSSKIDIFNDRFYLSFFVATHGFRESDFDIRVNINKSDTPSMGNGSAEREKWNSPLGINRSKNTIYFCSVR